MTNILLKKTLASMLNISNAQVDAIIKVAEAFRNNEIDKSLAIKLFNRFSTKTPQELNEMLSKIDKEF